MVSTDPTGAADARSSDVSADVHGGSRVLTVARAAGALTVAIAVVALLGWLTHSKGLAGWLPGSIPMAPSTAIALLLLGATTLAPSRGARGAAGLVVGAAAIVALVQWAWGRPATIDALLVPHPDAVGRAPTGRMSPLTGVMLALAGAGMAALAAPRTGRRSRDLAGLLSSLLGLAAIVVVLGYAYGTPLLYGGTVVPVALTTGIAFATLATALVALGGTEAVPLRIFCDGSARARLFRAFLPIAPAVVVADGLLSQFLPALNPALRSALLSLALASVVALGVARSAHAVGRIFDQIDTERRDRARAEREAVERARVLAESQRVARIGSYRVDLLAGAWTSSPMLDEIFGIGDLPGEKTVAGWLAIVHPDERSAMSEYFEDDVLRQRKPFAREYRIRRPNDGQERWVRGLGKLLADGEGRLVEMIGTIQDITEAKASETLLRQSQALEGIGRLAGGIAHDFNNLLGVITGYAELASKQLAPDHPARPRLDRVLDAAGRAARLSRQLLAFSRRQVMRLEVLDLNALLRDLADMLEKVVGEDVEIELRAASDLGAVRADSTQVERVVMNLVLNARDAMPGGGRLTIETANADLGEDYAAAHPPAQPGRYAMITVSDTGIGMDSETQKHVFEPFFTTKPVGEGTGLGLATVYGIVKQSGGYVWVYSELGIGTTFKVYLPRVDEPARPRPPVGASGLSAGGSETLLIVEDSPELRELVAETLADRGYTILTAADGDAALAAAAAHGGSIHLLLADVVLPRVSGPELGRRLAQARPGIRQLYMSGYAAGAIARERVLDPGVSFLEKPFSGEALARAVRLALDAPAEPQPQQGAPGATG